MTLDDYIVKLRARDKEIETTPAMFALAEEAIRCYPLSAKLWCIKGAMIQLGPVDSGYELEDALGTYRQAITVEPDCPDGWEELGHYYDVHLNDEKQAEIFWKKAEALKAQK
ncbi:hypothetical protein [Rariglobus hedericola]|uniref:Tetratricopeptide repeat protein n=1 Tax=Rariglobus hedericola TaxID=2597822 RepID=A0A556QDH4_9BACT|nr:hypothetical protein [Rariglobus hedericola]TSJ74695.1 hypothetical protein FPL22_17270 [Rariglobus hedericola]